MTELNANALKAAAIAKAKQESLGKCKTLEEQIDYERRTWPRILASNELEAPLRAYLAAAPVEPVAALEWGSEPPYSVARVPALHLIYSTECVWNNGKFEFCQLSGNCLNKAFRTRTEAKAAAQADFETRIRSALTTPPAAPTAIDVAASDIELLQRIVLPMVEQRSREPGDAWTQAASILASLTPPAAPAAIDVAIEAYYARQIEWSRDTFGPGLRTGGVIDHIRKELKEVEAEPTDLSEWVDVIILAMDGFWRHGGTATDLMPILIAKQQKNMARVWPDWRTMSENSAIEHDRSHDDSLKATKETA